MRALIAVWAVVALLVPGFAAADSPHAGMDLSCYIDPSTVSTPTDIDCSFTLNDGGSFGLTSNDKTDWLSLHFENFVFNEDENAIGSGEGAADPSHGAKVGEITVATDEIWNGCGGGGVDGGTYSTYWVSSANWSSSSSPSGSTKVAEYRTERRVLFFFTEQIFTHVYRDDTTDEYELVTDWPEARECDGAETEIDPLAIWSHANDNTASPWVVETPGVAGCYTVTLTATEVGGTTHTDFDTVAVGGASC